MKEFDRTFNEDHPGIMKIHQSAGTNQAVIEVLNEKEARHILGTVYKTPQKLTFNDVDVIFEEQTTHE